MLPVLDNGDQVSLIGHHAHTLVLGNEVVHVSSIDVEALFECRELGKALDVHNVDETARKDISQT